MGLADNVARAAAASKAINTYGLPSYATPPKPAAPVAKPVAKYIPSYANPTGKTTTQVAGTNAKAVSQGLVPKATQTTPKVTTPTKSLGTGSIETKTAPVKTEDPVKQDGGGGGAEKPLDVTLAQGDIDRAIAAANALRTFQENQANAQLTKALANIDRAALEGYKGMANDYAARGMSASGAYDARRKIAQEDARQAREDAKQAVADFLNELKYTGNLEQAQANLGKNQAFQDYINGVVKAGLGG